MSSTSTSEAPPDSVAGRVRSRAAERTRKDDGGQAGTLVKKSTSNVIVGPPVFPPEVLGEIASHARQDITDPHHLLTVSAVFLEYVAPRRARKIIVVHKVDELRRFTCPVQHTPTLSAFFPRLSWDLLTTLVFWLPDFANEPPSSALNLENPISLPSLNILRLALPSEEDDPNPYALQILSSVLPHLRPKRLEFIRGEFEVWFIPIRLSSELFASWTSNWVDSLETVSFGGGQMILEENTGSCILLGSALLQEGSALKGVEVGCFWDSEDYPTLTFESRDQREGSWPEVFLLKEGFFALPEGLELEVVVGYEADQKMLENELDQEVNDEGEPIEWGCKWRDRMKVRHVCKGKPFSM